jgi:hypothetical protein
VTELSVVSWPPEGSMNELSHRAERLLRGGQTQLLEVP